MFPCLFGLVLLGEISIYTTQRLLYILVAALFSITGVLILACKNSNILHDEAMKKIEQAGKDKMIDVDEI